MIEDARTLVVVADGRKARVFEEARRDGPLHEHPDWLGALPKAREGGKGEPPGRVFDRFGHASHGTHGETPHDKGEHEFLVAVAERIESIVREQKVDELILIAAPRALGVLREALPKGLQQKLRETDPHDRLAATADEIHQVVRGLRRASA